MSGQRKPGSGRSQSCCPSLSLCSDVVTCGRSPNGREMRRAIIPHLSAPDKNTAGPSPHAPRRRKPLLVRLGSLVAPNGGNSGCSSSTIRYQTGEEGDDDRDLPEKEEDEEVSPSHPQGHPPSSSFLCVSREEEQEEEEEDDRPRSGQSREHKGEGSFPFATTPQTSFSLSLPATGIGSERSSENLDLLTGRRRSLSPSVPFDCFLGPSSGSLSSAQGARKQ